MDRMFTLSWWRTGWRCKVRWRWDLWTWRRPYDTVPKEMVMVTLRWMRVPEAEVRLVEGMYKGA